MLILALGIVMQIGIDTGLVNQLDSIHRAGEKITTLHILWQ